jgi:uncharacterized membrane protein YfcA
VLAAAVPGLALGAAALALFAKPLLQLLVGLVVLAAAATQLRGRLRGTPAPNTLGRGRRAGQRGTDHLDQRERPPSVLWLESRGVAPAELRATLAACFLVLNVAGCVVLVPLAGSGRVVSPGVLLPLLGLVVAGHLAGARAFRRLDPRRFSMLVLALVALTGLASAVAGALALS